MKVARLLLCIIVTMWGFAGKAIADPAPTGFFRLPYSEGQVWPSCGSFGWQPITQFHMHFDNEEPNPSYKYHMGEDWNGVRGTCNSDSDLGAPLYAIADGQVVFLDSLGTVAGQGKRLYIRYAFPYADALNDVMTLDSAYLHLDSIASGITWTQGVPNSGSLVNRGQTVAYLGNSGTGWAHLHWEAQVDLTIPLGTNPYVITLTKTHALKYRAPSLIVDDRRDEIAYAIPTGGNYVLFTMGGDGPSSTAYIEQGGVRKSLKKAIEAGWLAPHMLTHEEGGFWYYWSDVDLNFFQQGRQYAISSYVANATLHIPIPRSNFQSDRARLDMLREVEDDSRVASS